MTDTKLPYYNRETNTLFLSCSKRSSQTDRIFNKLEGNKFNIYITAITKEDNDTLEKLLAGSMISEEDVKKYKHINLSSIIATGDGNGKYISFMFPLVQEILPTQYSKTDLPTYRSYENSYEKWEGKAHVTLCPDKRMSYESALRKLGAKGIHGQNNDNLPFYIVVWADTIEQWEIKGTHGL